MRVMISQPMKGKSVEQIRDERAKLVEELEADGHEVVDTIFGDPPKTENIALWCLGKSLEAMSEVDAVYFMSGWKDARGCRIEHLRCVDYDVTILKD